MREYDFSIEEVPFSWDDNFSEEALEDFNLYKSDLSYHACQSIGMALGKLKLIETGKLKVEVE